MIYIVFLCVIISFLFTLFISVYKVNKINTPIVYVSLIWHILLTLSLLVTTSLDRPDNYTYFIFIMALISLSFGMLSAKVKEGSRSHYNHKILYIYIFISFSFIFPPSIKMINILMTGGYIEYLKLTRWQGSDVTVLFSSPFIYSITNVMIKAMIYASFFYSCVCYFLNKNKVELYVSIVLLFLISVLFSSRIEILTMFLCIISCMMLTRQKNKWFFYKIIGVSCVGMSSILYFSYIRSGGSLSLIEIVNRYLIEYHTLGFIMFSKELMNPMSNLNSGITWGLTTLSIIDYIPEQMSRFLPYDYISTARESRQFMSESINVSQYKEANAFYTSVYLFYKDFNLFGVVVFSFIFGRFFTSNYLNWLYFKSSYGLVMVIFCIYSGYTALFYPPQVTEFYWFTIIFIYLLCRKLKLEK